MLLKIQNFLGEFPKIHNTKLKDIAAEVAQNISVDSGSLKTLYAISDKITLNESGVPTKDVHLCRLNQVDYWLQFKDFVRVIRSPIADDQYCRIYWSGDSRDVDGHVLFSYTPVVYQSGVIYPVAWYKLGIPAPTIAPTITSQSTTLTADELAMFGDEQRVYVYTYIGSLGEESAHRPTSGGVITPHDKSTVVLGNLALDVTASDGRVQLLAPKYFDQMISYRHLFGKQSEHMSECTEICRWAAFNPTTEKYNLNVESYETGEYELHDPEYDLIIVPCVGSATVNQTTLETFKSARLPRGKTATLNVPPSTLCAVVYLYPENQE